MRMTVNGVKKTPKNKNRAATRYQYIPQHRQFVSWNRT